MQTILSFAQQQGPQQGTAQYLPSGDTTSPYFAAMVNAAAAAVGHLLIK